MVRRGKQRHVVGEQRALQGKVLVARRASSAGDVSLRTYLAADQTVGPYRSTRDAGVLRPHAIGNIVWIKKGRVERSSVGTVGKTNDGPRKISIALQHCRYGGHHRLPGVVAFSFPTEEEKRTICAVIKMRNGDGPTQRHSIVILMEGLPRLAE